MSIFDTSTNTWSTGPEMPTAKETKAILKDGFIYVVGGYNGKDAIDAFERFDLARQQWQVLSSLPTNISANTLAVQGDFLFSFGNYDSLSDVFVFDFASSQWHRQLIDFKPRRHSASLVINNSIYVFGGTVKTSGGETNVIQRFLLNPNTASTLSRKT